MNKLKSFVAVATCTILISLSADTALAATYKVAPKDSLYTISQLFNTTTDKLVANNSLKTTEIYPGQKLDVPSKKCTLKKGDTLSKIAKKYNVSVKTIKQANHLTSSKIIIGKTLLIPAAQADSASKPAANPSTPVSSSSKAVIHYTASEVDLLARLITAEADGESYNAMVGVGGVVVNRVQSTEWPNSISGVVNQVSGGYYQFTPVKNGWINKPATDLAKKAAMAAINGSDTSKGAMFYFDDTSTNQWLWSKAITTQIDHMVFVK